MAKVTYCNMCGKEMDLFDEQEQFSLRRRIGYGSKYDNANLELDLCCDCMDELIDRCIISPIADKDSCYG